MCQTCLQAQKHHALLFEPEITFENDELTKFCDMGDFEYFKHTKYIQFSYEYVNNRYLVFIGGLLTKFEPSMDPNEKDTYYATTNWQSSNKVTYFDFKLLRWKMIKPCLPHPIYNHCSVLIPDHSHRGQYIHIMGTIFKCKCTNGNNVNNDDEHESTKRSDHDTNDTSDFACKCHDVVAMQEEWSKAGYDCKLENIHWRLNFTDDIEWESARQIWIAYYKNENNSMCLINKLPRDIILYILQQFLSARVFQHE